MNEPIDFAGNDYLGLARHPEVVRAVRQAAEGYGISAAGSRWSIGWTDLHERLEGQLAAFLQVEGACLLGSAYLGGAVYFGQMAARGYRTVFCDEMAHGTLYLGMRAAGAAIRTFRHLDVDDLRRQVASHGSSPAIIATDGVYGISGEIAPLSELAEVAGRIGAELFIDDAHGFGVLGETGRGTAESYGIDTTRATILGSLSKAIGAYGGFLAGRRDLVEDFRHSPEVGGTTAAPMPVVAGALAGLDLLRTQPELRARAHANAAAMRRILAEHGIGVMCDRHPIVAMRLESEQAAVTLSRRFLSLGLRIPYLRYPSEPRSNLLRAIGRAVYRQEHLARFAEALQNRPDE